MQWTFPETFGEDKFAVMLGGLHIEMALWAIPGTIVQGRSFDEYFAKVVCHIIEHELKGAGRVDIVWDQYYIMTIKGATRDKRGTGTRQSV